MENLNISVGDIISHKNKFNQLKSFGTVRRVCMVCDSNLPTEESEYLYFVEPLNLNHISLDIVGEKEITGVYKKQ